MPALRRAGATLAGLVVDDAALAILATTWAVIATTVLPLVLPGDAGRAVLLFAGLAAALVASALRRASGPPALRIDRERDEAKGVAGTVSEENSHCGSAS